MLAFRGFAVVGRSFQTAFFRQQFCQPSPICSVVITRYFAASHNDKKLPIIKRAKGPYVIFSEEKRSDVLSANPGLKFPEVAKVLGSMWKDLSEDEKQVYRAKFEKGRDELKKAQEGLLKDLTPEQKEDMLKEKRRKRKMRKIKKLKTLRKSLGRPKPAGTNAFLLFIKSKMLDRGEASLKVFIQGASNYWKRMAYEDKKPFIDEAKENSQKYKLELEEWEKKMLKEGQVGVFSKSRLAILRPIVKKPTTKSLKSASKKRRRVLRKATASATNDPVVTKNVATQTPELADANKLKSEDTQTQDKEEK